MIRLFLNMYNFKILGCVIVTWVLLVSLPDGIVPDFLHLRSVISSGTFGRISTAFISVFSFLVTVLVLAYGFLREKFRRLALQEFLENRFSRLLVSVFISVFIVSIFSTIYLDSRPVDHNSLNVAYFSLFLSIGYFVGFLPMALLSIASTDSQELIGKYIDRLSLPNFKESNSIPVLATYDENNPITTIIQLSRTFLEKDDLHSTNMIIYLSQDRIATLIGNSRDRQKVGQCLSGQRLIWDAIVQKAFQKKEYSIIENIFIALSSFHVHFSKNKIPLLYLEELRFFIRSLAERLVSEGLNDIIDEVIPIYEKILEHHYDNSAPPEEDLKELIHFFEQSEESYKAAYLRNPMRPDRLDTDSQWMAIYSDIPYFFSVIVYKAIDKKNLTLLDRALGSINHLIHAVYISKLGDRQKAWIIRLLSGELHYFQILVLKKGLSIDRIITNDSFIADRAIDDNSLAREYLLVSASEFTIELHQIGKLDYEVINFWGSLGRHCANRYLKSASHAECFNYILRVVEHLKTLLERNLKANEPQYFWLKDAAVSFIKFHKEPIFGEALGDGDQKKVDEELLRKLESLLNSFKPVDLKIEGARVDWDINGPKEMYRPPKR